MVISTVTLNPAVDKTYYVNGFLSDTVNRSWKSMTNIGGKGINISKGANICGYDSVASGFLAGSNGRFIEDTLKDSGISTDFVYISGETRVNIKIADPDAGSFTDINDCGPAPTDGELKALFEKVCAISQKSDIVHFGGSIQPELSQGLYNELILIAKENGAKTVLDAGGKALFEGIKARPTIIKPNQFELEEMVGTPLKSLPDILGAAKDIFDAGIENVLVSLGGNGALAVTGEGVFRAYPLNVLVESTVGAGDSFLLGYIHGMLSGVDVAQSLKFATSFSAAKIQCEGTVLPTFSEFTSAVDSVMVEKIG